MRNFKDLSRALATIAGGLKGIKDIIDTIEPSSSSSIVYSTTPTPIGTWIDSKTVYRVYIEIDPTVSTVANNWADIVDVSSLNIDQLIDVRLWRVDGSQVMFGLENKIDGTPAKLQVWFPGSDDRINGVVIDYTIVTE